LRPCTDVTVVDVIDLNRPGIAKIGDMQPDVVLVDLGQTDPEAAVRMVKSASGLTRLVAFAFDETDDDVFACAAAGFCGYVARNSGAEELYRTLVDVMEGRMHCAPHIAATMFARLARSQRKFDPQGPLPALSSRGSEILPLVEQGRSNKEIARQLAISTATVKNHMHNILLKLQVSRRGQAAARVRGSHAA